MFTIAFLRISMEGKALQLHLVNTTPCWDNLLTTPGQRTHAIGQKAAQSLYHAFGHAERIGLPLNTHATLNFAATICDQQKAVHAFSILRRNHFNKWAVRRGFAPTGAFAFENVKDRKPIVTLEDEQNVHVHWTPHIPTRHRREFETLLPKWLEKVTGGITDPAHAIKLTEPPQMTLRGYLLKGCVEKWAPIYGATAEPQGLIVGGRRTGTTANLRKSERIAADRAAGLRRRIPARPYASGQAAL